MTTRSYPGSVSASQYGTETLNNGTSYPLTGTTISTAKWVSSVTHGDNIPGWRDKLRRGEDATTQLTGTKVTAEFTPGYLKVSQPKTAVPTAINFDEVFGRLDIDVSVPTGNPDDIDSSKSDSQALGRFARRIVEVNTAFQSGVFLGELGQTLRMIRNPAMGLRKLVDEWRFAAQKLRRLRVFPLSLRKEKVAEALADAWLEVQYGWRPLLMDIDNGCQALSLLNTNQSLKTHRISRKSEVIGSSTVTSAQHGYGIASWRLDERAENYSLVVYRGAMRVEARDPVLMRAELLGFNPGSWLPTAWELIPYSFLVDYFSNVGEIIYGWSTLFTKLAWCNRTVKKEKRKTVTSWSDVAYVRSTGWPLVNSVLLEPAKYVCVKSSVSRAKYTGTYVPGLVFRVPDIGSLKWLNIAALVAARSSDRKWSYGD